jgi:hypothetical protein
MYILYAALPFYVSLCKYCMGGATTKARSMHAYKNSTTIYSIMYKLEMPCFVEVVGTVDVVQRNHNNLTSTNCIHSYMITCRVHDSDR